MRHGCAICTIFDARYWAAIGRFTSLLQGAILACEQQFVHNICTAFGASHVVDPIARYRATVGRFTPLLQCAILAFEQQFVHNICTAFGASHLLGHVAGQRATVGRFAVFHRATVVGFAVCWYICDAGGERGCHEGAYESNGQDGFTDRHDDSL